MAAKNCLLFPPSHRSKAKGRAKRFWGEVLDFHEIQPSWGFPYDHEGIREFYDMEVV